MIKTPFNSCWLWSSFRIAKKYCEVKQPPKDLHSELIIKYIKGDEINILKYNEETKKEADVDRALCGNCVEYLTLNGFFFDSSLIITPKIVPNAPRFFNFPIKNYEKIFAILIQFLGHFQSVIREKNNEYFLYDQSGNIGRKILLNIQDGNLLVPVCKQLTILYFFMESDVGNSQQ